MERYSNRGPVACDEGFDTSNIKGKSAVITGGANGIGEQYVRHLVKAGAYVTFGDIDEKGGKQLEADMQGSAKFLRCDVMNWDEQLALFKSAITDSPSKRVDIVCANAGIGTGDEVFETDAQQEEPSKPNLKVLDVNGTGALYTVKLALHYFRRQFAQNPDASKDQLLVLQSSVAGYLDIPRSVEYNMSKFGMRAVMRVLRWTEHNHGIRVNAICPWFIHTALLPPELWKLLESNSLEYAKVEDVAQALLKLASDPTINGRAFGILPRSKVKSGYADLNSDDYNEDDFMKGWDDEIARILARNY